MRKGESFLYPDLLLADYFADGGPSPSKTYIYYDIMCRYKGNYIIIHLFFRTSSKIWNITFQNTTVNYLIGQFHVLPHSRGCIQSMQPFTTKGNGNVDGEALERRWAYFRLHMSSFKQMSAENR